MSLVIQFRFPYKNLHIYYKFLYVLPLAFAAFLVQLFSRYFHHSSPVRKFGFKTKTSQLLLLINSAQLPVFIHFAITDRPPMFSFRPFIVSLYFINSATAHYFGNLESALYIERTIFRICFLAHPKSYCDSYFITSDVALH